jgi:hypothetical protein
MRVKLSNPKLFFDEILEREKMSLKEFIRKIDFNYSNLKQYRRGEKLIPKEVFESLLKYSSRKEFWKKDARYFEDNWGTIKGGLNSAKKDKQNRRLSYARKFRKIKIVDIQLNEFFCELYGALLGDGCITKFKDYQNKERYLIYIVGNKKLDSNYLKYLQEKITKEYGIYVYYYEYKNKNVCMLSIKNKGLCLKLNREFDIPIGLKYGGLKVSNKILELPWKLKKFILRGLFDTDGCILANKRENYRYPWIIITSKSEKFRNQLTEMLREQGYPAYCTGKDVCVRGISNVNRWFTDIGSSNSRNLLKYQYFLKHGSLPARLLTGP